MHYDNKIGERQRSQEWYVAPQNHSDPCCRSIQSAETLPIPSAPVLQVSFLPATHHCTGAAISLAVSKLYQLKNCCQGPAARPLFTCVAFSSCSAAGGHTCELSSLESILSLLDSVLGT